MTQTVERCDDTSSSRILDLVGEVCPMTFVRARVFLAAQKSGAEVTLLFDHEPARRSLPRSLEDIRCEILENSVREDGLFVIRVRRPNGQI